jgi:AAA domain
MSVPVSVKEILSRNHRDIETVCNRYHPIGKETHAQELHTRTSTLFLWRNTMDAITPKHPNIKPPPFALNLIAPYSTFKDGKPIPVPYVISGLLIQGGFSILGGKPKAGKSSSSRYEAVCVAKGIPFLGRDTTQGEVVLISLEDTLGHTDNCLKALGWNPETDARITIVEKLAPSIIESIHAIENALEKMPHVRLVIVDTLAKLLRVRDMNDYSGVMEHVEKVHDLARNFPKLHVQGLVHCKKARTDNPFDSLLGSTVLRGETDTNIVIYEEGQHKVIAAEVRQGRNIEPTILEAEIVESAGANIVKRFSLGQLLSEYQTETSSKKEMKRTASFEELIIRFLMNRDGNSAGRVMVLANIPGRKQSKVDAIKSLVAAGVVTLTGDQQSNTNGLTLHLDRQSLQMHDFLTNFGGVAQ